MRLCVRFELDVEDPGAERLPGLVAAWLDGGSRALAGPYRTRIDEGPELPREAFRSAIPCGPPHAAWGLLSLHRSQRPRKSVRIPTSAAVRSLLAKADDAMQTARIALYTLDGRGYPNDGSWIDMWVVRNELAPQTLVFMFAVWEDALDDPQFAEACAEFVRGFAAQVDPLYGETNYDTAMPEARTVIEAMVGPPWVSYRETVPTARQRLRGYGWLTVVPRELAAAVGGADGLRACGVFAEVTELPSGAVWLRATHRYADYDVRKAEDIVRALASILPPGMPDDRYARAENPYIAALLDPSEL